MRACAFVFQLSLLSWFTPNTNIMAQQVEELVQLPKDTLVKMAIKKIDEPSFDVRDFDQIEIWADENDVTVMFDHAIRFIPRKGQYYYSATVDLISGTKGRSILGSPDQDELEFYKPKQKHKEKIQFVLNSINKSNGEIGKIPEGKLPDGIMTITEKAGHYEISVDSKSTSSDYKIKKGSGKIYDGRHKHMAHDQSQPKRRQIY